MHRGRDGLSLPGWQGNLSQITRVVRVFPLAILVLLGGIGFPENQRDMCMVHPCPAIQLLPHVGPHPACPFWRRGRLLMRPEQVIHWQRSKCHFTVTQRIHFLIHRTQPGHLSWPRVGGSGWGHKGPLACPSPTPPQVCTEDPKDPIAAVLAQSKEGMDSHASPALTPPGTSSPGVFCPPVPQHSPCLILTQAGVPQDPPPRQRGGSDPCRKAFGKYFPWRSAPRGNISPADGM